MQVTGGHRLRVVLLAGLPYSGKTNLALKLRELGWDHIQHHSESSVESLQSALRSSLEAGRDVVVDAKNLTKTERQQWLSVASQTVPKAADGSGGVSQFVVILAMNPIGPDAARLDPTHLEYRQQYLSPQFTAGLSQDKAVEYIHSVIVALDSTFEVPYTTEGIDSLAHVRTQSELEQVLGWLSHASQYGLSRKPGWSTPVPSSALSAATQWSQAHGLVPPVTAVRAQPAVSVLPPAPTGMGSGGMGMGGASSAGTNHMSQGHFIRQNDPSPMMTAMAMGAGVQGTHMTNMTSMTSMGGMASAGAFNYSSMASQSANSFSPVPSQSPAATFSTMGAAPATYIPTMALGQGPTSQFNTNNGGFQGQGPLGGFNGGFVQQGTNSLWAGSSLQPVKQEYGDGMPSKRPYEHGPGATEAAWNPPDVKRQAGPSSLPHQAAHLGMQGMAHMGMGAMRESRPMQHRDTNSEPLHKGPPQPVQVDMSDPRPIILFELSGVLCNSTKDRMSTRTRNHMPRPGIGHLARLMPHFRIGIYSTAIKKTVLAALAVVSSAIRGELASSPDGWKMVLGGTPSEAAMLQAGENGEALKGLEVPPEHKGLRRVALTPDDIRGSLAWGLVFDENLILHREHTDMTIQENREITVKAVKTLFPNPEVLRRILVVDEPHFNQQDENFIALKKWDQDNRADSQIPALVDSLLAHLHEAGGDVRSITGKVSEDLKAAASISVPRPVYKPVESTEGYYETYPLRPGAEPCSFYLETGHCRFGEGCHFHHPPENRVKLNRAGFPMHPDKPVCQAYVDSGFCDYGKSCMKHHPNLEVVPGATRPNPTFAVGSLKKFSNANFQVIDEDWTRHFPQRENEQVCTHFTQNGTCRYGAKCKFHHPLDAATPLNNYGYPMRLHAPVCEYFCKTGSCRFGVTCSKHHPNLSPGPAAGVSFDASMRSERGGIRGGNGWARAPDSAFDITDSMDGFFAEFASNPGKEICPNFRRTGHCKFGPSCMFDHPPEFMVKLNRLGLPLRPGAEMCKFYLTNGECGYGRQCMHHHPNIVPKGAGMVNNGFSSYNGLSPEQGWGAPPAMFSQPAFNGPPADSAFLGGQTMVIIPQQQFSQW